MVAVRRKCHCCSRLVVVGANGERVCKHCGYVSGKEKFYTVTEAIAVAGLQ